MRLRLWLAPLSAALCLWLAGPIGAAEQPTCAGKPATIVSDAPRFVGTGAHDVILAGPSANVRPRR